MGNAITAKIEASKSKAALTRKDKQANREAVKQLAALHMESAIKKLSEIVADKKSPSSAKVAAATQLLDRVAGKPRLIDERETEQSQLERMSAGEVLAYICENISGLSTQARAVIAEALIATERGVHLDYSQMVNEALEAENEPLPESLPPLEPKRPKKEPRR